MKLAVLHPAKTDWRAHLGDALPILEAWADAAGAPLTDETTAAKAVLDADAVICLDAFGIGAFGRLLQAMPRPVLVMKRPLMWHPYDAQAKPYLEAWGCPLLPSDSRTSLEASLAALTARKRLQLDRLLVYVQGENVAPEQEAAAPLAARLGCGLEVRDVAELQGRAAEVSDAEAREVLARWRDEVLASAAQTLPEAHLVEVAKLYLAEKAAATECGATALTIREFEPFLFRGRAMPNVTYAILKNEGILTAEEGDVGVLATQVLLRAATGLPNTMSNVYMAWRDAYDAVPATVVARRRIDEDGVTYTRAMEREDFEQCRRERVVVASHFGSAGSLPLEMMVEDRYELIETTPAWPGQSMLLSTPRLGPVVLGRIGREALDLDLFIGKGIEVLRLERDDWYRLRWLIRTDTEAFIAKARHHHWAVAQPPDGQALALLVETLLGMELRPH